MIDMDIRADLEEAHRLKSMGRYNEAIARYDRIIQQDPKNTSALENKGEVYYYLGRHEDAIACYDQALAINPGLTTGMVRERVHAPKDPSLC